jgi:hypothetical protein
MMKLEAAALALSAVSLAGVLFAVSEVRSSSSGIGALSDRVAKLEISEPAAGSSASGPTNADLAREIAVLRAQVTALAARPAVPAAETGSKSPADPAVSEEAANKAKAEEATRQEAWLEGMSKAIVNNLTQKLALSAQQTSQVSDIIGTQLVNFRKSRLSQSGEEVKAALAALYAETNEKIKLILTSEQQSRFDEIVKHPGGVFALQLQGGSPESMVRPGAGNVQGR